MSKMKGDQTAINNLKFISDSNSIEDYYQFVIDGNTITDSDDNNYEGIVSLKELEYPIYFSFHQLFTSIRYSNLYKINNYKTKDIIKLMDYSLDTICDLLNNNTEDPHNESLCEMVDEINNKFIIFKERDETCSFWKVYETFNDYLDTFSEALLECNRYLYITPPLIKTVINGEINKKTGEKNPNLIYSDDENDGSKSDSDYDDENDGSKSDSDSDDETDENDENKSVTDTDENDRSDNHNESGGNDGQIPVGDKKKIKDMVNI